MNDIFDQRPQYFEGEYLGADDLQQLVVYMRDQDARHSLGAHAWGIGAGLDLVEQGPSSGPVDVYLMPGYAVDGYGRTIVVVNPLRLTFDMFNGLASGPQMVWLYYDQAPAKGVRPGFEVCGATDASARISESYDLAAGDQVQPEILVSGVTTDARTALQVFDSNGPIVCDGSVPFQQLPIADETSHWFVPLGLVGWKPGTPGQFQPLTAPQRLLSRRRRRYLGVIAENVLAADGLIRLRRRQTAQQGTLKVDDLCDLDDLAGAAHDADIATCNGQPEFNELVWVEGRMRVTDDARLLGGRLELRDAAGSDYLQPGGALGSVPTLFDRADSGSNADLRLVVGTNAGTGANRFLVARPKDKPTADPSRCGRIVFDPLTALLTVRDDAKVGIGTDSPDQALEVVGTADTYVHVNGNGAHDLFLGIDKPSASVSAINAVIAATGSDLSLRAGGTDPNDKTKTQMTITGSGVAVGTTTPAPNSAITIEGPSAAYLFAQTNPPSPGVPATMHVGVEGARAVVAPLTKQTDLELHGGNDTPAVWIKDSGNVGIGTNGPVDRLDVWGNIRMSSWLYAAGSADNLLIIAGTVNSAGAVVAGSGFSAVRNSAGHYQITFSPSFLAPPVVIANVINPTADDDVTMVKNVTGAGAQINTTNLPTSVGYEDLAFSFVAFGIR